MQAARQYGEAPQYVASRVGASHGHMFNLPHEMSLSSSASQAQGQAHGNGLSLSHPATNSPASQSHIQSQVVSASTQPLFLQSQQHHHHQQQQQQQHVHHGLNVMSMGGATPRTSSPLPPMSVQPLTQTTQALQSAAQQLQADITQHQQQQSHQFQQTAAHDFGVQQQANAQKQATNGDPIVRKTEEPEEERGNTTQIARTQAAGAASSTAEEAGARLVQQNKTETSGDAGDDGDELELGGAGERGGGNRWPKQEALALLKLRSEMDATFRDSSIKGPLWEEISRKLAEMGYHRSGKKCKEKFENVHKYYKRTKEGKTGRQDGKSYRFFTQLEALYGKAGGDHHSSSSSLINLNGSRSNPTVLHGNNSVSSCNTNIAHSGGLLISLNGGNPTGPAVGLNSTANHSSTINNLCHSNVSGPLPLASFPPSNASLAAAAAATAATNARIARTLDKVESMKREPQNNSSLQYFLDSSDEIDDDDIDDEDEDDYDDDDDDEDDDEDEELDEPAPHENVVPATSPIRGKKRKRESLKKYLIFFEKIMKKVLDKQEHMQQKFLEALEKRDQDRMIREEAWKRQEMVRLNREHDVRAAERALSASRDASLVALLQKMTGQSITLPHIHSSSVPLHTNNHHQIHHSTAIVPDDYMQNEINADRDAYDPSSKRWPKPEVLALIKLRTSLDQRFHEPGSKAILWEEISAAMTSQGYARTAKRCKEKWENINKYFKKAKESNKKRPENAKTCPYFHHLNALYKEGLLGGGNGGGGSSISSKFLMVTEKGEEQSEGMNMDQGVNTSKYNNGEERGQVQEGDSAMLPAMNEIDRSALPPPADPSPPVTTASAIKSTSHAPRLLTTASLTLMTCSTPSSDTKMHMFMGTERGDIKEHAGILRASNDITQPQSAIDLSTAFPHPQASNSLSFKLDQSMSSNQSLPSAPMAVKQSEQSQT